MRIAKILFIILLPLIYLPSSVESYFTPTGKIGSSLQQNQKNMILCISDLLLWPVGEVVNIWNQEGRNSNKFSYYYEGIDCTGRVVFYLIDTKEFWGHTKFYFDGVVVIVLSTQVPVESRQHVLCHELGHSLGLPHNKNIHSCMNHEKEISTPTQEDLAIVAQEPWDWRIAARQACGC
jgi:hypothetical protein